MQAAYSLVSRLSRPSRDELATGDDDNERRPTAAHWKRGLVRLVTSCAAAACIGALVAAHVVPEAWRKSFLAGHGTFTPGALAGPAPSNGVIVGVFTIQSTLGGTLLRSLRMDVGLSPGASVVSLVHATPQFAGSTDGCYRRGPIGTKLDNDTSTSTPSGARGKSGRAPGRWGGLLRVAMLRAPRAHVLNLYLACRASAILSPRAAARRAEARLRTRPSGTNANASYDAAPHHTQAGQLKPDSIVRTFPGAGPTAGGEASTDAALWAGLRKWLAHFETGRWVARHGDWGCAHPRSMQARALTCAASRGAASARHILVHSGRATGYGTAYGESTGLSMHTRGAISTMRSLHVVGVAELFEESACLVALTAGVRPPPPRCHCTHMRTLRDSSAAAGANAAEGGAGARSSATGAAPPVKEVAASLGARPRGVQPSTSVGSGALASEARMLASLPDDILQRIDALTATDTKLYLAAANRLIAELRAMETLIRTEAGAGANFSLLCPERLAHFQRDTSYVSAFALRQFIGRWQLPK